MMGWVNAAIGLAGLLLAAYVLGTWLFHKRKYRHCPDCGCTPGQGHHASCMFRPLRSWK